MSKIKKLLIASLATASLIFSASICASADAQIDSLSVVDNTIYAHVNAENARLYAVDCSEGLLSDAFFTDVDSSKDIELPIGTASEYELFLWDKDSLAPVSAPYKLVEGRAYPEGSQTPLPEFVFSSDEGSYTFDQEDDVMIVSAISNEQITGYKAGVLTTYSLVEDVAVVGLSDKLTDVVPGSLVLTGVDKNGNCAAIELLASIGLPVDREAFEEDFGVYAASDKSTKYKNIVDVMASKSGSVITLRTLQGAKYAFESLSVPCYRVGIAMDGETPVITYTVKPVSEPKDTSVFADTSKYYNYVYLRLNTEASKTISGKTYDGVITQCILYGEYSPIFGLEPIIILE